MTLLNCLYADLVVNIVVFPLPVAKNNKNNNKHKHNSNERKREENKRSKLCVHTILIFVAYYHFRSTVCKKNCWVKTRWDERALRWSHLCDDVHYSAVAHSHTIYFEKKKTNSNLFFRYLEFLSFFLYFSIENFMSLHTRHLCSFSNLSKLYNQLCFSFLLFAKRKTNEQKTLEKIK